MSAITQRIASAFVVLCGRYGDVTKMAHDREQSRQSLYREASQVANAVDGTAVQSRIDELQRQLAGQQAQIQDLQERLEHAIEITRDKQDEFASVAQAEGVSLSVARRLLQVLAGSVTTPSVPTLGRATEEAGQAPASCLKCSTRWPNPRSNRPPPTKFFWAQTGLDARRTRKPVLVGGRMVEARDGQTWAVDSARFSALVPSSGTMAAAWARGSSWSVPDVAPKDSRISRIRWTSFTRSARGRALRKTWARPRALERAEAAQKELDRLGRAGESRTGHATRTSRLWRQAEGLWDQAMAAERAWRLTRSAFEFFTPEGRFNDPTGPGGRWRRRPT